MRIVTPLLLFLSLLAAPAAAQTDPSSIAARLSTDSVYVDPAAQDILSAGEADALRAQIRDSDAGPMYVAVLPEEAPDAAGGSIDALLSRIAEGVGRSGTYVLVAGNSLRAGATDGTVSPIADQAIADHRGEGLPAILEAFVEGVEAERTGGATSGGGGSALPALGFVGLLAVAGGAMTLAGRSRRRREESAALEEAKDQVRDELVELGEGIGALDLDVEMPGADEAGREDYARAVGAYDRANTAWSAARTVDDLAPVGAALEEGRWALASAKARLEGRTPPDRRAPCFFDPRHGPSSRDVVWAPPGGAPREVPACEADALTVEQGIDPGFRQVAVGGQMVPYWAAGPQLSPFYAGGMFGGFGIGAGLLGGLMLGSMFSPGMAWGYGDDGSGLGGDFAAGDFGGGDFGGDFGGGDFGGGDF